MSVEFEDYSIMVKRNLEEKLISSLYEVGGEMESQVKRMCDSVQAQHEVKGSYSYKIDKVAQAVHIGSNLEHAIWDEFGTGRHALHKDGRRGWWVYVKNAPPRKSKSKNIMNESEARQAVAVLRSKGLEAYCTEGKKPKRPLKKAFDSTRSKIIRMIEKKVGELN